jgi:hypothetical protein
VRLHPCTMEAFYLLRVEEAVVVAVYLCCIPLDVMFRLYNTDRDSYNIESDS